MMKLAPQNQVEMRNVEYIKKWKKDLKKGVKLVIRHFQTAGLR